MMLGTLMNKDRRSLRNPPKNGTTLQSGMSSERLTASRYSSVSSRDIRAPHSHLNVDRSSSTIDSQNGFNLSDLEWAIQMKHIFIKFSHYSWIRKNSSVILKKIKKNLFFWRKSPKQFRGYSSKNDLGGVDQPFIVGGEVSKHWTFLSGVRFKIFSFHRWSD